MVFTDKVQINHGSKLTYGGPLYVLKYVATATGMSEKKNLGKLKWSSMVAGQDVGSMEYIWTLIGSSKFFAVHYS